MSTSWIPVVALDMQRQKNSTNKAIIGLQEQVAMLQKREKHLQSQIDEQDAIARRDSISDRAGEFIASIY